MVPPDLSDWLGHFKYLLNLVNIFFGFRRYAQSPCNLHLCEASFAWLSGKHPSCPLSMFMYPRSKQTNLTQVGKRLLDYPNRTDSAVGLLLEQWSQSNRKIYSGVNGAFRHYPVSLVLAMSGSTRSMTVNTVSSRIWLKTVKTRVR